MQFTLWSTVPFPQDRTTSAFEIALRLDEENDAQAAVYYRKAIDAGEAVADAYCNLGIIESEAGNHAKAFDCFTQSLKHAPRHAEAHFNLGNLYFELNEFNLAQVHFELAAEVEPAFANAHYNLALIHTLRHNLPAAAQCLRLYFELSGSEQKCDPEMLLREWAARLPSSAPQ